MGTWFTNLRISAKLGAGFGLCLALCTILAWSAISCFQAFNTTLSELTAGSVPALVNLENFDSAARQSRIVQIRYASEENAEKKSQLLKDLDTERADAEKALEDYAANAKSPEDKKNVAELTDLWHDYDKAWTTIQPGLQDLPGDAARALTETELTPRFLKIRPVLDKISDFNIADAKHKGEGAQASIVSGTRTVVTLLIAAIAIGIVSAVFITKKIVGPIVAVSAGLDSLQQHCVANLDNVMRRLANGDLTMHIEPRTKPVSNYGKDEVGQMAESFNSALGKVQGSIESYTQARHFLSNLIGEVSANAESVSGTSQSLAAASQQSGASSNEIASGSSKLAQNAADAATVMEELSAQVTNVGDASEAQREQIAQTDRVLSEATAGIEGVATSAQNMASVAAEGNAAVRQTIDAMVRVRDQASVSAERVKELDASGKQIGDIVRTIEGIAGQTNLLALNAAIEAARAGEHGRGFAVVADEVRKLAEQTGTSTKEIASLIAGIRQTVDQTVVAIDGTTKEVASGVQQSEQAGQALQQILRAAEEVAKQAESVSSLTAHAASTMKHVARSADENVASAREMQKGSRHVAGSISNVAAVSEEAAAGAEELTASIEEVGAAASELASMSQSLQSLVAQFKYDKQETNAKGHLRVAA